MSLLYAGPLAMLLTLVACGGGGGGRLGGERAMRSVRETGQTACSGGNMAACDQVCGALGPKEACEKACAANLPASCMELGIDATYGLPRPGDGSRAGTWATVNPGKATELLGRACKLGYSHACADAALQLLVMTDLDPKPADETEGVRLLMAGCTLHSDYPTLMDARWMACLELYLFHANAGHAAEAEQMKTAGCALSPGACKTLPQVIPHRVDEGGPPESALVKNNRAAAIVRGKNYAFGAAFKAATDRQGMIAAARWDHSYLTSTLPRLLSPGDVHLRALLVQYDRIMHMGRIASVTMEDLAVELTAYENARLDVHMVLGQQYGLEVIPPQGE